MCDPDPDPKPTENRIQIRKRNIPDPQHCFLHHSSWLLGCCPSALPSSTLFVWKESSAYLQQVSSLRYSGQMAVCCQLQTLQNYHHQLKYKPTLKGQSREMPLGRLCNQCLFWVPSSFGCKNIQARLPALPLYVPQAPKARGLTMIGVLIGLAGGEGWECQALFCDRSLQGRGLHRHLKQRLLGCKPQSISATGTGWYYLQSSNHHSGSVPVL